MKISYSEIPFAFTLSVLVLLSWPGCSAEKNHVVSGACSMMPVTILEYSQQHPVTGNNIT